MNEGYAAFIEEQLSVVGPVRIRRMFGGAGVFLDGVMFALIASETLYFKADETTKASFESEDLEPFTYEAGNGKRSIMSYWRAPERVFDDPDEMRAWAGEAVRVAQAAAARKPPKKKKASKAAPRRKATRPAAKKGKG